MKKNRAAALVLATGLLLTGCGQQAGHKEWAADTNSIYINQAMEIESALVYTSENQSGSYQAEELKAYAQAAVDAYNQEHGAADGALPSGAAQDGEKNEASQSGPVRLKECSLDGASGRLVFAYADGETFTGFAQATGDNTHSVTALSVSTVADALVAGALMDGTFLDAEGKAVPADQVIKQSDYRVAAVTGSGVIQTEGKVAFVSEGVTIQDRFTVVTPEGESYVIFQ